MKEFLKKALKNTLFLARSLAFVALTLAVVMAVNTVLTQKAYYDQRWSTTNTYAGFYDIEENTVDVLFLGSSHTVCSMNPQYLYNQTGIKSYNLGCEQQSMITSYYWLKEALRYQKPKAVVLDTLMAFEYEPENELNCLEGILRRSFDFMKWSEVKWEAVNDLSQYDDAYDVLSFIFPNIRYHERWSMLTESDFKFGEMTTGHNQLKGYLNFPYQCEYTLFTPLDPSSDTKTSEDMLPAMKEYLDRIVTLCEANDIELILTSVPYGETKLARYNTMKKYAEDHKLTYIDMNTQEWFDETGFNFAEDNGDGDHVNTWGSEIVTKYLGQVILQQCPDIVNENGKEQWEETRSYYKHVKADNSIMFRHDVDEYVRLLDQNKDRYIIYITTHGYITSYMDDEVYEPLKKLGLKMDIKEGQGMAAVIDRGEVAAEKSGKDTVQISGSIADLGIDYTIQGSESLGSSICVDGYKYSPAMDGFDILIYDTETEQYFDRAVYHYSYNTQTFVVDHYNYINSTEGQ